MSCPPCRPPCRRTPMKLQLQSTHTHLRVSIMSRSRNGRRLTQAAASHWRCASVFSRFTCGTTKRPCIYMASPDEMTVAPIRERTLQLVCSSKEPRAPRWWDRRWACSCGRLLASPGSSHWLLHPTDLSRPPRLHRLPHTVMRARSSSNNDSVCERVMAGCMSVPCMLQILGAVHPWHTAFTHTALIFV